MFHRKWLLALPACALLVFSLAHAQQGPRRERADRERRGGAAPAEMRQRWMDNIREQLGANEEEWKALQPKVEKVTTARRDAMGDVGGFAAFRPEGRRGARGREAGDRSESEVAKARRELRATLAQQDASSEEITAKLKAFREARDKARAELAAAQKELKEACTPRQEAVLVTMGILE